MCENIIMFLKKIFTRYGDRRSWRGHGRRPTASHGFAMVFLCVCVCFFFFFFFFFLIFFKVWGHYNLRGLVQFPLIFG
jgi:hypothetical protein